MGDVPEILQLLRFPATSAIIAANCTAHYVIRQRGLGYGDVGSSHRLVWKEGQWWRAVTASFSHVSIIHLGFNMFSTWQLRGTEATLGSLLYLHHTGLFVLFSILFQQLLHCALAQTSARERTENTMGVGYSCVVFAWMTWSSLRIERKTLDLFFVRVPYSLSPFASLIITQLMIPNVDLVGHLAGIIAGYWQVLVAYFHPSAMHWHSVAVPKPHAERARAWRARAGASTRGSTATAVTGPLRCSSGVLQRRWGRWCATDTRYRCCVFCRSPTWGEGTTSRRRRASRAPRCWCLHSGLMHRAVDRACRRD